MWGDLNNDNKIDSVDLIILQKYLSGTVYFDDKQKLHADVNRDGVINALDLVDIKKDILNVKAINQTPLVNDTVPMVIVNTIVDTIQQEIGVKDVAKGISMSLVVGFCFVLLWFGIRKVMSVYKTMVLPEPKKDRKAFLRYYYWKKSQGKKK